MYEIPITISSSRSLRLCHIVTAQVIIMWDAGTLPVGETLQVTIVYKVNYFDDTEDTGPAKLLVVMVDDGIS